MQSDREEKIRARAHQIWEREGRPSGREHVHWEEAAREIEAEAHAGPGLDETLRVTPFNDPTRPGGPVEGAPYPLEGAAGGKAPARRPSKR